MFQAKSKELIILALSVFVKNKVQAISGSNLLSNLNTNYISQHLIDEKKEHMDKTNNENLPSSCIINPKYKYLIYYLRNINNSALTAYKRSLFSQEHIYSKIENSDKELLYSTFTTLLLKGQGLIEDNTLNINKHILDNMLALDQYIYDLDKSNNQNLRNLSLEYSQVRRYALLYEYLETSVKQIKIKRGFIHTLLSEFYSVISAILSDSEKSFVLKKIFEVATCFSNLSHEIYLLENALKIGKKNFFNTSANRVAEFFGYNTQWKIETMQLSLFDSISEIFKLLDSKKRNLPIKDIHSYEICYFYNKSLRSAYSYFLSVWQIMNQKVDSEVSILNLKTNTYSLKVEDNFIDKIRFRPSDLVCDIDVEIATPDLEFYSFSEAKKYIENTSFQIKFVAIQSEKTILFNAQMLFSDLVALYLKVANISIINNSPCFYLNKERTKYTEKKEIRNIWLEQILSFDNDNSTSLYTDVRLTMKEHPLVGLIFSNDHDLVDSQSHQDFYLNEDVEFEFKIFDCDNITCLLSQKLDNELGKLDKIGYLFQNIQNEMCKEIDSRQTPLKSFSSIFRDIFTIIHNLPLEKDGKGKIYRQMTEILEKSLDYLNRPNRIDTNHDAKEKHTLFKDFLKNNIKRPVANIFEILLEPSTTLKSIKIVRDLLFHYKSLIYDVNYFYVLLQTLLQSSLIEEDSCYEIESFDFNEIARNALKSDYFQEENSFGFGYDRNKPPKSRYKENEILSHLAAILKDRSNYFITYKLSQNNLISLLSTILNTSSVLKHNLKSTFYYIKYHLFNFEFISNNVPALNEIKLAILANDITKFTSEYEKIRNDELTLDCILNTDISSLKSFLQTHVPSNIYIKQHIINLLQKSISRKASIIFVLCHHKSSLENKEKYHYLLKEIGEDFLSADITLLNGDFLKISDKISIKDKEEYIEFLSNIINTCGSILIELENNPMTKIAIIENLTIKKAKKLLSKSYNPEDHETKIALLEDIKKHDEMYALIIKTLEILKRQLDFHINSAIHYDYRFDKLEEERNKRIDTILRLNGEISKLKTKLRINKEILEYHLIN